MISSEYCRKKWSSCCLIFYYVLIKMMISSEYYKQGHIFKQNKYTKDNF